ncbi:hypothetical protein Q9L58_010875, partial [Maublancomyces gigas]
MAGDFNTHHALWYAEHAITRYNNIRNNKKQANALVEWIEKNNFILHNIPGVFTDFPHSDRQPSVLDLSLSRGLATVMIHGWSCDPGNRGTSDHAPVTLALQIKNPTFTPRRLNRATNWAIFGKALQALRLPEDA